MRRRFDLAAKARAKASILPRERRGVWLPLYIKDDGTNVRYVGGGAGLDTREIARIPLEKITIVPTTAVAAEDTPGSGKDERLTIPEAKRRLALHLGVPESAIKISVEA